MQLRSKLLTQSVSFAKLMKNEIVKISGIALCTAILFSPLVLAAVPLDDARALAGSEVSELSGLAARCVANAEAGQKTEVAIAAVRQALALDVAADVPVVFAVVRENEAGAPAVVVTASRLRPDRMALIVNTASAAAPSQAGRITAAMIKEFPPAYDVIAVAAAQGAPSAGREVLAAVGAGIPALRAPIQAMSARFPPEAVVPVAAILAESADQAVRAGNEANVSKPLSDSPVLGPAFSGSVADPTFYTPAQTATVSVNSSGDSP